MSYGWVRSELLGALTNGCFLLSLCLYVVLECIPKLITPEAIEGGYLFIAVAASGLGVNTIGTIVFCLTGTGHSHSHGHSHSGGSGGHDHDHGHSHTSNEKSSHHGHSHSLTNNANMKGVFLHVLADTLGSVGVIISSLLIQYFGWNISDPICSLFISIMIFLSVLPLLKDSAMTLLLQTPSNIQYDILDRILKLDQVQSYSDEHFWNLSSSTIVGTIHIQIANDGDEQRVTAQVQTILKEAQLQNVAIQVEKQVFFNHLTGLNSALGQLASSQRTFSHK